MGPQQNMKPGLMGERPLLEPFNHHDLMNSKTIYTITSLPKAERPEDEVN